MSSTQRSGASGTTGWSLSTKAAEAKHNKKKGVRRESKDLGKPQGWKSRFKAMVVGRFRKLNAAAEERHRQRLMQKREALRLLRRRMCVSRPPPLPLLCCLLGERVRESDSWLVAATETTSTT